MRQQLAAGPAGRARFHASNYPSCRIETQDSRPSNLWGRESVASTRQQLAAGPAGRLEGEVAGAVACGEGLLL